MLWVTAVLFSLVSALFRRFETAIGLYSFMVLGYLVGTPNYTYNGDAIVYAADYMHKANMFESGYNWICSVAGNYINYSTFRLYSSLIVYFLLFVIIRIFTNRVTMISLFSSIAIFPFDNEQVRNGMLSLFVLFCAYLLVKWNKAGIVPALLVIYCGSLFHSLGLLFMFLPVVWMFRNNIEKHFKLYFSILSIISVIIEIVGPYRLSSLLSVFVARFSSRSDIGENVSAVYNNGTFYIWLVFYLVTIVMLISFYGFKNDLKSYSPKYYQLFLCAMILWGGGLILLTLSVDYLRILRLVGYFYFILIASLIPKVRFKKGMWLFVFGNTSAILLFLSQMTVYGLNWTQIESIFHLI